MDRFVRISSAAVLVFLSACATHEILTPYGATAPDGVDFSGTWIIRDGYSADQSRIERAVRGIEDTAGSKSGKRKARKNKRTGSVHVFLRMARTLKISQTPHALFVSLDRSVVQEFRFGENREISIGEIVAQRASGWDGSAYVVDTLDKKGVKLSERYWLSDERNLLHREIKLRSRNNKADIVIQLFDRTES